MGHRLKRIFIGPGFDGMSDSSSWKRKGKQKVEPSAEGDGDRSEEESVWEDEGSTESDASSNWERVDRKRKLARGVRRGRKDISEWSESTAPGQPAIPMRSRRPSMHDWKGNSFEIGAEFKDMVHRREKRLKAEREQREKDEQRQGTESAPKFLKDHSRGRTNSTATAASRSFAESFVTARSQSPTSAPPPSPAAFQLSQPPLHIDEKYPEITQTLFRRSSEPRPALERSTSDTPAILLSTQPASPIRSILRTQDICIPNGSALGNGRRPVQNPTSPMLEVPQSFGTAAPRLVQPPRLARREASNAASVRFPDFPTLAAQQQVDREDPPTGDQPPAPPLEVLSRPAPQVKPHESKLKDPRPFIRAAADKMLHRKKRGDEVLRKERMLVRDDWSQRDVSDVVRSENRLLSLTRTFLDFVRICRRRSTSTSRASIRRSTASGRNSRSCGGLAVSNCGENT